MNRLRFGQGVTGSTPNGLRAPPDTAGQVKKHTPYITTVALVNAHLRR